MRGGTLVLAADFASSSGTSYAVDSIEALDAGATLVIPGIFNGATWASTRDQIAAMVPGTQLKMTGGTLDLFDEPKNSRIPVPDGTGLITNTGTNVQAGLIMVADGLNHTFSGVIADGGPWVGDNVAGGPTPQGPGRQIGIVSFAGSKNGGGGLWTLSGSNTYSGSTRIDQGASIKLVGNGTIGFPTATGSLTGPMRTYGSASDPTRGYLDLNGHNQTIALMQNGNADAKVFNSAVSSNSAFRLFTVAQGQCPDTSVSLVLNYSGTAPVRQLWIDGVQQPNGEYGAGTPGINPNSTGTITVTGYAPAALGFSQSGDSLTFSWQGLYKLQSQTNHVTGPWYDYPNGGTSPVNVILDRTAGSVFFRLSTY